VRTLTISDPALIGGGVSFSPLNLAGIQIWNPYNDTSKITDAGSGAVSEVLDSSGNGYTVSQGTAGLRPTTAAKTLNSRNVLDFDGGDRLDTSTHVFDASTKAVTFFAVVKWDTITADATGLISCINSTPSLDINTLLVEHRTAGGGRIQIVFGTGSGDFANANYRERYFAHTDLASYHILVIRVDTSETLGVRCRYDRAVQGLSSIGLDGTCTGANFLSSNAGSWRVRVGTRPGENSHDGPLAEWGMYNVAHSDADCIRLEDYLALKWGL